MSDRSDEFSTIAQPTCLVSSRNSGLEVEPGEARLISSAALLAQDADTPSTSLRYRIQSVPTQGLLQLKVRATQPTHLAGVN